MKEIILYGAGKTGKKVARILNRHGIQIAGFCDSMKTGNVTFDVGGGKTETKPILDLENIAIYKYVILITISDYDQSIKVRKKIDEYKIEITTVEQVLYPGQNAVSRSRDYVAEYHADEMEEYFLQAEQQEDLMVFWREDGIFRQMFRKLNIKSVIELACGRGRHVPQYSMDARKIVLVDILKKNIDYCKERFGKETKISYCVNNGYDLRDLESETYTALFTYDSMVHFEMLDIFQYLKETYRILVSGGRALFHHSNSTEDYRITYSTGTYGRNYMGKELFAYLSNRAGLIVLEQHVIDWNGKSELDCLTLVEKPNVVQGLKKP